MVKLLVKKLLNCYPKLLPDFNMDEGSQYDLIVRMTGDGIQSAPAQTGSVEVLIEAFEGDIETMKEVIILDDEPVKCYVEESTLLKPGQLKLKLRFNTVFFNDFKQICNTTFIKHRGLLGFAPGEMSELRKLEQQKAMLEDILNFIFPWKKDNILPLALQSNVLIKTENDTDAICWFNDTEVEDPNNAPNEGSLFHVCRLDSKAFKDITDFEFQQDEYIDIFIDIQNTEDHWPYKKDEFKVKLTKSTSGRSPFLKNLTFKSTPLLDLPAYDDSIIENMKFSEEDEFRYEGLDQLINFLFMEPLIKEHLILGEFTKIGGYPDMVQSCVVGELKSRLGENEIPGQNAESKDWKLLMQITPDVVKTPFYEKFGYGTIYFLIPEDDFKIGNFDNVEMVVQGT